MDRARLIWYQSTFSELRTVFGSNPLYTITINTKSDTDTAINTDTMVSLGTRRCEDTIIPLTRVENKPSTVVQLFRKCNKLITLPNESNVCYMKPVTIVITKD